MGKIFMQQDAANKIKIELPENNILEQAKKFFGWRKGVTIQRINKLGTSQRDKFIAVLANIK